MKVIRESAHLYRLTRFGMVNCFLLEHDKAFTLIDTNLPRSANSILCFARTVEPSHATLDQIYLRAPFF